MSKSSAAPALDIARLRATFDGLNAFGRNPETGGYDRVGFSDADMAARRWFAEQLRADGFVTWTDGAANVFGRFGPKTGPCVMAGSHIDSVPSGGAFDGALGVCVAWECLRAIRDSGLRLKRAIEVVATAEEEGRFGGMLGSQAIAGQLSRDWLDSAQDASGVRLADAMRAQGLEPARALDAARPPGDIAAFLELHVEQGPALEAAGLPIGVAGSVSGVCNLFVRLEGRANHSGTTPMALRADAFAGLAEAAGAIPEIIAAHGTPEARVTIGQVDLQPNHPHTIPGVAEFSVILRDVEEGAMRALTEAMKATVGEAARRHGLSVRFETRSWLAPVALDADLARLLLDTAAARNLPALAMTSGAGHDAQTLQAICPAALIFVPSRGGVSHAPAEHSDWGDIEKGAELMLAALTRLACDAA